MKSLTERERMLGELLAPDIGGLLDEKRNAEARAALLELAAVEAADVLMAMEPRQRMVAFRILPRERAAEVFTYLLDEQRERLIEDLSGGELATIFNDMAPDDRAELFEEMPGEIAARVLALMRPEERRQVQVILGYPPESVGRLMTPDYLTVRPAWSVQQVIEHIRAHGRDAETINYIYVTDDAGRLLDSIRLRQFLLAAPTASVESLMSRQVAYLRATDDREEAVRMMDRYDRAALPVVDGQGVLVGIVTFDDVADVAQEETTEDIQKMAAVVALDEPYLAASVWQIVGRRGVWLTVLFLGQLLTATVMERFEARLAQVLALVIFIPLIISSGGNSGSQATSLIIRAMALGEVELRDWWRVLRREVACAVLLGLLLGAVGLLRVLLWQWLGWANYASQVQPLLLALVVAVALVGVVLWGSLVGSMLPFLLRSLRLDPATSSAPFVATLVDVTGLVIYFTAALAILRQTLG